VPRLSDTPYSTKGNAREQSHFS